MLEALKAYEEAARLDLEAAAVFKAQIPILLTLSRDKDAIKAIDRALELDPGDHETWFIAARLHKSLGHDKETRHALKRGLEAPGLLDRPDIAQQMYLDLAGLCEAAEEIPQAIAALGGAAKILDHPDALMEFGAFNRDLILARAADTHERMGNLYRKQKNYKEALTAFKKAQEANPEHAGRLNYNLSQLLQEQGRLEDSLVYLDAYLRFQPLGLEAYEMKVDLLGKLGKDPTVVPWLEQASRADSNNLGLKVFLAKQYARANQYTQAERLFKSLADESPNPEIYRGLFHLYEGEQQVGMAMALTLLNKTLDQAAKTQGPPGMVAQQAKAMITALRDDGALAKALVKYAVGQNDRELNLQFETLHILALMADKHQKLAEAEKFYRQSLPASGPTTEFLVYSGLLRVLWKEHKFADVVQVCKEGLKRSKTPNQVLFLHEMAKALARLERMDEALCAADRAVNFAGDNPKSHGTAFARSHLDSGRKIPGGRKRMSGDAHRVYRPGRHRRNSLPPVEPFQ